MRNVRKKLLPILLLIGVVLAIFFIKKQSENKVEWTMLVYMNGNNSLHLNALKDFIEIKNAEVDGKIKVLVQLSRRQDDDTNICGNWFGTERFEIEHGLLPFRENALTGDNAPINTNMDSPDAFIEFLTWGQNYSNEKWSNAYSKSHKFGLFFWDHGKLLKGTMGFDFPSKFKNINSKLANTQLSVAFG